MASDLRGYTEQETLNKVLNTDNDSIQVDIVDATGVSITTTNDSVYADDADWTDTTSKHTLVGGLYQSTPQSITDGDVGPFQVDADGALHISDGGNTITVDGTVTANLGSTDNTVLDNIAASLAVLDDWDDSNLANVNLNLAGSDADKGEGALSSQTLRVSLATDDDGVTHLATIAGDTTSVDGKITACNTGAVVLASGSASVGKVEAVGDVAEDAAVAGNPVLTGGRYDATQRTLDDGDVGALALDPSGALYTREYTGQDGAVYTTASSDVIVPPDGKTFVAIQMLEDTTFDSSGGLIAVTATRWFNTEDAAGDLGSGSESTAEGSGGKQIDNSVTFPQGMTIFGRWSGIDVNSGSVIAYIGDY